MHLRSTAGSRVAGPPTPALRVVGSVAAVLLGAVGIWLIVTGTSQKWTELGVLAGLWGLLIGAFVAFGPRQPADREPAAPAGAPDAPQPAAAARPAELDRVDDAIERRRFETRLETLLRAEIQSAVAREVSGLRAEVAALRTELIEKVGGELRLERIETTRIIGSDLEALQREVDQLKRERRAAALPTLRPVPKVVEARHAGADLADDGGRRRRKDDGENDLLSQILARETVGRHGR